jgi:hypothetical protein
MAEAVSWLIGAVAAIIVCTVAVWASPFLIGRQKTAPDPLYSQFIVSVSGGNK